MDNEEIIAETEKNIHWEFSEGTKNEIKKALDKARASGREEALDDLKFIVMEMDVTPRDPEYNHDKSEMIAVVCKEIDRLRSIK